jgi:hypothetical protein
MVFSYEDMCQRFEEKSSVFSVEDSSVLLLMQFPGSITGRVTGDISEAPDKSMCPGSTKHLRNEYQGISGGKGGRCVGLTTLPP